MDGALLANGDAVWAAVAVQERLRRGPVAAGGSLDADFVYGAYRHGLYPVVAWSDEKLADIEGRFGDAVRSGRVAVLPSDRRNILELTWLSPDPRAVLRTGETREGSDVRRTLRRSGWCSTVDRVFGDVVRACSDSHPNNWITPDIVATYEELHRRGLAHSFEVWEGSDLVGGTYGVLVGRVFSGESIFHRVSDAGKAAVADLVRRLVLSGVVYYDCQEMSEFNASFGAIEVARARFIAVLRECRDLPTSLFCTPMELRDWAAMTL